MIHRFTFQLPKYEMYEIGSQVRRSSKSVSVNIVEGYGRRRYKADYVRFLIFAQASCDETIEWLEYIKDCYPGLTVPGTEILNRLNQLGKKINNFIASVEKRPG
jgi:four helix bundle protein